MEKNISYAALPIVNIRLVEQEFLVSDRKISNSNDAAVLISEELSGYDREVFCVLNLKNNGSVINMNIVSIGDLNSAAVHPREVFKSSILSNAAFIIAFHNHPSGDASPSETDIETTKRLADAGKVLGIPLVDHIVVGRDESYSFLSHGLLDCLHIVAPQSDINEKGDSKVCDNAFVYGNYHFIPYRRLTDYEKNFNYVLRNTAKDTELGIMNYDVPQARQPYDHSEFYVMSTEKTCDIFLCTDNGKLYIPCENELMRWIGDKGNMDPEYSKRSNIGYEIFKIRNYGSGEIVIGCNPRAVEPFACWYCKGEKDYFWGRYGMTLDSVMKSFNERCQNEERMAKRTNSVKGEKTYER